jgi:hypothetical protein
MSLKMLVVMGTRKLAAALLVSLAAMVTISDEVRAADLRIRPAVEREAPLTSAEQRRHLFEEFLQFLREKAQIYH